jgi:hypothetical protein
MTDFVEFKIDTEARHSEYECRLAIERSFGSIKLKVIESFTIKVRIYY